MKVGGIGTWTLECEMPKDIPPEHQLVLYLSGTRWVKNEMVCQTNKPEEANYISACIAGGPKLEGIPPDPDADSKTLMQAVFKVPDGGIAKGDRLKIVLGDTSFGGPGLKGPRFTMRNAFFTLETVPSLLDFDTGFDTLRTQPTASATQSKDFEELPSHLGKYIAAFLVDFIGGALDNLLLLAPSQVISGKPFSVTLRPQDERGNIASEMPTHLIFQIEGRSMEIAVTEEMINPAGALDILSFVAEKSGLLRITVEVPQGNLRAESNPIRVLESKDTSSENPFQNLYWGLIHEHTELSDGMGSLDQCFTNFRYGSRLNFGTSSDHDHIFETTDEMWELTCQAVKRYHEPGEFVTFLGYEWAKWRQNGDGDRNVYYLEDDRPMYRSETGQMDNPQKLFDALSDEKALVIPHHTAYTGNFCDWKDHNPLCERLVEIYSVWGNSEMGIEDGNPIPVRHPNWNHPDWLAFKGLAGEEVNRQTPPGAKPVGFVQNALAQGWRVGFTAGGDMHLSHPGDDVRKGYPPTAYKPGLLGVWAEELTRQALWDALFARRCYATTGARMIVLFAVNAYPMGSEFNLSKEPDARHCRTIKVSVSGVALIEKVEIICNNQVVHTIAGDGKQDINFAWEDKRAFEEIALQPAKWTAKPFVFYYARIKQTDREMAWASPVWVD